MTRKKDHFHIFIAVKERKDPETMPFRSVRKENPSTGYSLYFGRHLLQGLNPCETASSTE